MDSTATGTAVARYVPSAFLATSSHRHAATIIACVLMSMNAHLAFLIVQLLEETAPTYQDHTSMFSAVRCYQTHLALVALVNLAIWAQDWLVPEIQELKSGFFELHEFSLISVCSGSKASSTTVQPLLPHLPRIEKLFSTRMPSVFLASLPSMARPLVCDLVAFLSIRWR